MMNALQKLQILSPATRYEPAEEVSALGTTSSPPRVPEELAGCVHYAALPGGKRIPLLKTLLSSACERNCHYCPFRSGRDFQRATFTPEELARFSLQLYQKGIIQGIFLSSALSGGGPRTQDRIIAAAEILRRTHNFRGYLHVKVMPGAERDQIAAAMRLADRVSLNLEAPNAGRLSQLAPHKRFSDELFERLRWIDELRRATPGRTPSATTQFVVGGVDESDVELLSTTAYLYRTLGLARAYYSSFNPVPGTPLSDHPASPPQREHRLYQASFLLRDYGFDPEELSYDPAGNLPLSVDPKIAWARQHLGEAPVELNTADREMLLRVPGIGPKGAMRILAARRQGHLRELKDLKKLGIAPKRAIPYILLDGKRPPHQLTLWDDESSGFLH